MRIVTPPLEINENDGFTNDALGRDKFGKALRNIVLNSSDELVISLDGRWGEGKTTFVKMWQGLLNESNIPNIYINAFETDYVDDPFIAVASAITDKIPKGKKRAFLNRAQKVSVRLLPIGAKIAAKVLTLGAINSKDVDNVIEDGKGISNDIGSEIGSYVKDRLTSHSDDIKAFESFKQVLSELPQKLNKEGKPLVIIIDELDRCKPTYALEMIEKVKHLFSVNNVVFVLVMNKKHIEDSIKCIYGQIENPHEYLQKFINIEIRIPVNVKDNEDTDALKYCRYLFDLHSNEKWLKKDSLIQCVVTLSQHFNLSFRQLERVITNLSLFFLSCDGKPLILEPIISFLAIVKVVDNDLFDKLKYNNISFQEIYGSSKILELSKPQKEYFRKYLKLCLIDERTYTNMDRGDEIIDLHSQYNFFGERLGLIPFYAHKFSMFNV